MKKAKLVTSNIRKSLAKEGIAPPDIAPGQTVNVDHVNCPAGADTRARLYVSRKPAPADLLLAYCHNCGLGGVLASESYRSSTYTAVGPSSTDKSAAVKEIWERSVSVGEASREAKDYWEKRNVMDSHFPCGFLRFDPVEQALVTGIWKVMPTDDDFIDTPCALQIKPLVGEHSRWLTMKTGSTPSPMRTLWLPEKEKNLGHIVVVEDMISAAHVASVSSNVAYCLFGAHATMEDMVYLKRHTLIDTEKLVVWLDNDNPHVLDSSEAIIRRAKLVGFDVRVERTLCDPKYWTESAKRSFKEYDVA